MSRDTNEVDLLLLSILLCVCSIAFQKKVHKSTQLSFHHATTKPRREKPSRPTKKNTLNEQIYSTSYVNHRYCEVIGRVANCDLVRSVGWLLAPLSPSVPFHLNKKSFLKWDSHEASKHARKHSSSHISLFYFPSSSFLYKPPFFQN